MTDTDTATIHQLRWRPTVGFAARLRLIRLEYAERAGQRITQGVMADLIGVNRATYASWEAGNSRPADIVETAKQIEDRLGADPTWLLDLTDEGPIVGPGQGI